MVDEEAAAEPPSTPPELEPLLVVDAEEPVPLLLDIDPEPLLVAVPDELLPPVASNESPPGPASDGASAPWVDPQCV